MEYVMGVVSVRMPVDLIKWLDDQKQIMKLSSRSKVINQIVRDEMRIGSMQVCIYVDMTLAMLAGKKRYGYTVLRFNPKDLTSELRDELAKTINKKKGYFDATHIRLNGRKTYFPKAEATLETLKEILMERIALRKTHEEKNN